MAVKALAQDGRGVHGRGAQGEVAARHHHPADRVSSSRAHDLGEIGAYGVGPSREPSQRRRFGLRRGMRPLDVAAVIFAQTSAQGGRFFEDVVQLVVALQHLGSPQVVGHFHAHFLTAAAQGRQTAAQGLGQHVGRGFHAARRGLYSASFQRGRRRAQQVARQSEESGIGDLNAENLGGHIFDLVGFIEDHQLIGRQHLGVGPATAQGQVGQKQVMVDHHHLGPQRAPSHLRDETALDKGAAVAQSHLRAGRDLAPDRGGVGHAVEIRPVAGAGGGGPGAHALGLVRLGCRNFQLLAVLVEAAQAQVVGQPLHHRKGERLGQHALQARQVHLRDLVLQGARPGADHHLAAGKNRRHQVGDGLARAGARLGQQALVHVDGLGHALGHGELARARLEARQVVGQEAAGAQDPGDGFFERHSLRIATIDAGPSSAASPLAVTLRKKQEVALVWHDGPLASTM